MYTLKADGHEFTVSEETLRKTNILALVEGGGNPRIQRPQENYLVLDVCPNKLKALLDEVRQDDHFIQTLKGGTDLTSIPQTGGDISDLVSELFDDGDTQIGGANLDTSVLNSGDPQQINQFFETLQDYLSKNPSDTQIISRVSTDPNVMNYIREMKQTGGMAIESDIDSIGFVMTETSVAPPPKKDIYSSATDTIGFRMTTEWNSTEYQKGGDPTDTIANLSSGTQMKSRYIDVLLKDQ